jgi:hypothetical protein
VFPATLWTPQVEGIQVVGLSFFSGSIFRKVQTLSKRFRWSRKNVKRKTRQRTRSSQEEASRHSKRVEVVVGGYEPSQASSAVLSGDSRVQAQHIRWGRVKRMWKEQEEDQSWFEGLKIAKALAMS